MRILTAAALAGLAVIALSACQKTNPSAAGSQASAAGAPAGGSAAPAATGGDKYACTNSYGGKTITCAIYSDFGNPISLAGSKQACSATAIGMRATVGATCPSQDLIGCCTHKYANGAPTIEACSYKGSPLGGTPATCAQQSGVWSATP